MTKAVAEIKVFHPDKSPSENLTHAMDPPRNLNLAGRS